MISKYYVCTSDCHCTAMYLVCKDGRRIPRGKDVQEIGPFDSLDEAKAYVYDRYFDSFWTRIVDTP